jgi:hypothetical protein
VMDLNYFTMVHVLLSMLMVSHSFPWLPIVTHGYL